MPRRNPLRSANNDALEHLVGRWKVHSAYYEGGSPLTRSNSSTSSGDEPSAATAAQSRQSTADELMGVEFTLDEQYDVIWHLPLGTQRTLLFQTTSFDVNIDEIELMGSHDGRSFIFEYTIDETEGEVHLVSEVMDGGDIEDSEGEAEGDDHTHRHTGTEPLHVLIKKVRDRAGSSSTRFSLLDALQHGYFSDLTIQSNSGQQFPVHRAVLSSSCPGVRYRDWEMMLAGLSTTSLKAALHYIYTGSLPSLMTIDTAKELTAMAGNSPKKLSRLIDLCKGFIENLALKKGLQDLVDGVMQALQAGRQIVESTEMTDPAKVAYTVKQLAREAAVGLAKFILICQMYTENKQEMNHSERRELLEYVQARVVVFIDQVKELLELVLAKWKSLSHSQQQEIVAYMIPEVERIWGMVNSHAKDLHGDVAKLKKGTSIRRIGRDKNWKLSLALQFNSRSRDMKRLRKINKEFQEFVVVGEEKRQRFMELSDQEKTAKLMTIINEAVHDGQEVAERLEDMKRKILMSNALEWKSYKLTVSIVCCYTSWGLSKVLSIGKSLKPLVRQICQFVQSPELNHTLIHLGVVEAADLPPTDGATSFTPLIGLSAGKLQATEQPSTLADGCCQLLQSQQHSDMTIVLVAPKTPSEEGKQFLLSSSGPMDQGGVEIPAHRVVLAARSEWFQRALQSGMKEAIDRRIVVQDIEESLFRIFLKYLYGKSIDLNAISQQEVVEILTVADRYETSSLRHMCQVELVDRVDDTTVFPLLVVADQLCVRSLREKALRHILGNPDVVLTEIEGYSELPDSLKQEIRQLLSGMQDPSVVIDQVRTPWTNSRLTERSSSGSSTASSSSSSSTSGPGIRSYQAMDATVLPDWTTPTMMSAIDELMAIIGESDVDRLRTLLLAADFDLSRAVNYYFAAQDS